MEQGLISTDILDLGDAPAAYVPHQSTRDAQRGHLEDIFGEDFDPEEVEDNAAASSMTLTELEQAALQIELRLVAFQMQLDTVRDKQRTLFPPSQEGNSRSKYVSLGSEVRFVLSCFTVGRLRGLIARLDRRCERYRRATDQRMHEAQKHGLTVEEYLALEETKADAAPKRNTGLSLIAKQRGSVLIKAADIAARHEARKAHQETLRPKETTAAKRRRLYEQRMAKVV